MKKTPTTLFLAVGLLLLAHSGWAQEISDYHPIEEGCTWSYGNEKYMISGDTVLDGRTYLKMYRQIAHHPFEFNLDSSQYFSAIRNDTAEKQVYVYLPAGTNLRDIYGNHETITSGMDALLYDFSLELNESVHYYTVYPSANTAIERDAYRIDNAFVIGGIYDGNIQHVQYIDDDSLVFLSDSSVRHRILLSTSILDEVWIEGIGGFYGFNDCSEVDIDGCPIINLLCYSTQDGAEYRTGYDFDGMDDCFTNAVAGLGISSEDNSWTLYPNPVEHKLHISGGMQNGGVRDLYLYDIAGHCILHYEVIGNDIEIDMRAVPSGVYVLKIITPNGISTHKVIKL